MRRIIREGDFRKFFLFNLKTLRKYLMGKCLTGWNLAGYCGKRGTFRREKRKQSFVSSEKNAETQYSGWRGTETGKKGSSSRERALEGSRSYICRTVGGCQRARRSPSGVSATRIATGTPRVVWESGTLNAKLPQRLPDYPVLSVAICIRVTSWTEVNIRVPLVIRFESKVHLLTCV